MRKWEREHFEEYGDLILKKGEDFLPAAIGYRVGDQEEYQEISASESDFLSLESVRRF